MADQHKTKAELLQEMQQLRQRIAELEAAHGPAPDQTVSIDALTKYQLLADVARDILLFMRASDWRILDANRAAEEAYGYTHAELLNLTLYDLRAPSTRSLLVAQLEQAMQEGVVYETIHQRRDGTPFPVEVRAGGLVLGDDRIVLSIVRDITQRKQAEEVLRHSEERFAQLFYGAPVAFCLARASDRLILDVNDRFLKLVGYRRSVVIGRAPFDLNLVADNEERTRLLELFKRQDYLTDQEVTLRVQGGKLRQVLLSMEPVRLKDEDCLLITLLDITERQRIAAALRQSEERFAKAFLNSPIASNITRESDGQILEVNDRYLELFDYERADMLGHTTLELGLYANPDERAVLVAELRGQGFVRDYELTARTRTGAFLQVLISAINVNLNDEECVLSAVIDITGRKQLELEIASMARFPLENPHPVFRLDGSGRVLLSNKPGQALLDMWAHTTGDVDLAHWHDLARLALLQQTTTTVDVTCAGRNYSVTVVPLVEAGYVNLYAQDITARKQAEAALQELNATLEERVAARTAELQIASNRLQELDHLKDEFVARISHELRTPLTNVQVHVELLRTGPPERHAQYLKILRRETQRLRGLIEDLLKINQLTSDLIEPEPEPTHLRPLLQPHLNAWRQLAERCGLAFQTELAADLPAALIDPMLIVQVIAQLIQNAVSYTAQGTVTLSTAQRQQDGRVWLTVSVADTGPGIAPDELPHIFERFYRGRAAANYKTPGTGVGLFISRDIVMQLDGQITVASELGRGSTFTVWLPTAAALQ